MLYINEIELASNLADKKIIEEFLGNSNYPEYKTEDDLYVISENGDKRYKEEVEDSFLEYYEFYGDEIEKCIEE